MIPYLLSVKILSWSSPKSWLLQIRGRWWYSYSILPKPQHRFWNSWGRAGPFERRMSNFLCFLAFLWPTCAQRRDPHLLHVPCWTHSLFSATLAPISPPSVFNTGVAFPISKCQLLSISSISNSLFMEEEISRGQTKYSSWRASNKQTQ